jgi:hypothetical protein
VSDRRVQLLTATHPVDPEPRRSGWEYGQPITIADNVWLGGGVIVCPGVSISENTVVGRLPWSPVTCPRRSCRPACRPGQIGEEDRAEVSRFSGCGPRAFEQSSNHPSFPAPLPGFGRCGYAWPLSSGRR